jgi:hypothetical protein
VWSTTWDRLAADGRSAYGKGHYRLTASGHDTAGLLARHLALGFQLG